MACRYDIACSFDNRTNGPLNKCLLVLRGQIFRIDVCGCSRAFYPHAVALLLMLLHAIFSEPIWLRTNRLPSFSTEMGIPKKLLTKYKSLLHLSSGASQTCYVNDCMCVDVILMS